MNLILFSVTTFAVLDYFYRFMRFVSTDLAKIAKFLCFYSKSGLTDTYPILCDFITVRQNNENPQKIKRNPMNAIYLCSSLSFFSIFT